ncbi:MAG: uncharacterized protein QOK11_4204 [Pseudonocardiales bacterium]|nr:uncharacterized protein [Pseudonocardiales bacterium]
MTENSVGRLSVELDVPVPMRDGTVLKADVFRPATGSWPVLLQRTPYGKQSRLGTLVTLDPVNAAATGFAVVVQDVRGRFASAGDFAPFDENADGFDSVEWAAAQPWSTGRVGMFGASYMAATQWHAAVTAPPHLAAICPVQASSDYYEGRSYRGGAFEFGALLGIALNALGQGSIGRADPEGSRRRELWGGVHALLADVAHTGSQLPLSALRSTVAGETAPFFFDWLEHDHDDEYWQRLSINSRLGQADVPALHISSWFDQYLVGTLANYEGMRGADARNRDEQRLVIGPWNHYPARTGVMGSARVGDLDFGLGAIINTDLLQLRWFTRHLAGDDRPLPMRSRVRLFVMGTNVWRDEDEWPLARAVDAAVYLGSGGRANTSTGDGRLSLSEPGSEPPDQFDYDPHHPVPTVGGAHLVMESQHPQGPVDQTRLESRDDVLVYTSLPMSEDLEVTGRVHAVLWVMSSAPCTDFTARLVDVYPDGRAIAVCDGIRRVRLAEAGSDPGGGAIEIRIDLAPVSQVFRAGHALRLDVSSSNFPRFDLNPNTGQRSYDATELRVARQHVLHDREHPSRLVLPVVTSAGTNHR